MLGKILSCDCGSWFPGVAPLVLRVALGAIFVYHGYDKVFNMGVPAVSGFLDSIGIPLPGLMAYVLAYGELAAGALLILGLFTHWAAKYAAVVGVVALFVVHLPNGFSIANGGYEFIMLILAAAISVMFTGAGKYSVDAMWRKRETLPM